MTLPRRYRKIVPYVPPEPAEGLRKVKVDSFSLDRPYDLLSEEHTQEQKTPNNVLENVNMDDLSSRSDI